MYSTQLYNVRQEVYNVFRQDVRGGGLNDMHIVRSWRERRAVEREKEEKKQKQIGKGEFHISQKMVVTGDRLACVEVGRVNANRKTKSIKDITKQNWHLIIKMKNIAQFSHNHLVIFSLSDLIVFFNTLHSSEQSTVTFF